MTRQERRLVAILAADVAGYSRLMACDEIGTLARFSALRIEVIDPKLAQFKGRLVGTAGDSLLVEFTSAVDAVQCAVETQERIALLNIDLPEDSQIVFRMGVNLGEVISDGVTIHGDSVNVAARLEKLAKPGAVVVARSVRDQVKGKLPYAFADLGEHAVKNIAEPLWAFDVVMAGQPAKSQAKSEQLPLPSKPSIAVLPFANLSSDPQEEYFADGLTEDIITELSRFKGLFVIARNSAFAFKAKSIGIAAISKELGVRFLLEGSVRRSGDRVRITARLVDANAGSEVWAERYDRVIEDIFAVQDEVVRTIVATLEGQLASTIASQSRRQIPSSIAAYESILQARKHLDTYDIESAEPLLRRAIAADPRYAQAHAWMAMVYWVKYFHHHRDADIAEAVVLAKTAVALDPGDSVCHMALGFAYIFTRQLELAGIHSQRALELNPADMLALSLRAQWLCRVDRSPEAIETLDRTVRQDPFPPDWYWENRTIILLTLERYEEALEAVRHLPEMFWWDHGYVAICCSKLGRLKEAQEAVKSAIKLRPELTIDRFMHGEPYKNPADAERMIDGLRAAGLPE